MTKPAQPILTRRNAVAALTVGVATTGAIAATGFGFTAAKFTASKTLSWWEQPGANLATAGSTDWTAQVGSVFTLQGPRGNIAVKLAKVEALSSSGPRPRGLRDRAFALSFDPVQGPLPEGDRIYTLKSLNAELPVYFSPTGKSLLAVFN